MKAEPLTHEEIEEIRARYAHASPTMMNDVPRLLATFDALSAHALRLAAETANALGSASLWETAAKGWRDRLETLRTAATKYVVHHGPSPDHDVFPDQGCPEAEDDNGAPTGSPPCAGCRLDATLEEALKAAE